MSTLADLEASIVGQLQTVAYLATSARGVSDIKTFIDLTTVMPPAAIVVFDGEAAAPPMALGRAIQESKFQWTIYLVSLSFGTDGEGRITDTTGSYAMVDDVFTTLEGFTVSSTPLSRLYYMGSARYNVLPNVVIYESKWYNNITRIGI